MLKALLIVTVLLGSVAPVWAEYTWFLGINEGKGWCVARVFETKWECYAEQKKWERPGVLARCAFWRPSLASDTAAPRPEVAVPTRDRDTEQQGRAEQRQEEEQLRRRAEKTEYCNRTFAPREREKCMKDFEPVRR